MLMPIKKSKLKAYTIAFAANGLKFHFRAGNSDSADFTEDESIEESKLGWLMNEFNDKASRKISRPQVLTSRQLKKHTAADDDINRYSYLA